MARARSAAAPVTTTAEGSDASRRPDIREDFMEPGHTIDIQNTAYFRHVYDGDHSEMRRLYEQAKRDQWNAATDIDWVRPLEGDGGLIADDLVDIYGTRYWDRLSEAQRVELNRRVSQWRLSTLVHGEHG